MSVDHYENFPVASLLVPPHLRRPIAVIYHFARSADDLADEGTDPPAARLAALAAYRAELERIAAGTLPQLPLFADLAQVIRDHNLPLQLFHDLLDAFAQDVVKTRYANYTELLDYCRRSANPVGRLVLHLFGRTESARLQESDAICTALQLINFWQDVAIDWKKDRVYLPQEDLTRFGVGEPTFAALPPVAEWAAREIFVGDTCQIDVIDRDDEGVGAEAFFRIGFHIRGFDGEDQRGCGARVV